MAGDIPKKFPANSNATLTLSGGSFNFSTAVSDEDAHRLILSLLGEGGLPAQQPAPKRLSIFGERGITHHELDIAHDFYAKNFMWLKDLSSRLQSKVVRNAVGIGVSNVTCNRWYTELSESRPELKPVKPAVGAESMKPAPPDNDDGIPDNYDEPIDWISSDNFSAKPSNPAEPSHRKGGRAANAARSALSNRKTDEPVSMYDLCKEIAGALGRKGGLSGDEREAVKKIGRSLGFTFKDYGSIRRERFERLLDAVMAGRHSADYHAVKSEFYRSGNKLNSWSIRRLRTIAEGRGYAVRARPLLIARPESNVPLHAVSGSHAPFGIGRVSSFTHKQLSADITAVFEGAKYMKLRTLFLKIGERHGWKSGLSGRERRLVRRMLPKLGFSLKRSNYRYHPFIVMRESEPVVKAEATIPSSPVARTAKEPSSPVKRGRIVSRITDAFHHVMSGRTEPIKTVDLERGVAALLGRKLTKKSIGLDSNEVRIVHTLVEQLGYRTELNRKKAGFPTTFVFPLAAVGDAVKPSASAEDNPVADASPDEVKKSGSNGRLFRDVKSLVFSSSHSLRDKFGVPDVIRALGLDFDRDYLPVWSSLDAMYRIGSLEKFSYNINGKRRVYFGIKRRGESVQPKKRVDLPSDTGLDVLLRIFDEFKTFTWEALMQVRNRHGDFYGKWSAKGLFKWIVDNKEYAEELTKKRLSVGGEGDFMFVQVLDDPLAGGIANA